MFSWDTPDPKGIYEWSKLNDSARPVIESIASQWKELLCQEECEEKYHQFLADHAGLFFCDNYKRLVCISKLRLGADYKIDFAVAEENYSYGLCWELIEIESPHVPPYTKAGISSARLSCAIQQIQDWKRWLIDNRRDASKIFPARGIRTQKDPNFRFTIIIGNRENTDKWLEKRNQLAEELNIAIRSYDYLTDTLMSRCFLDRSALGSSEESDLWEWDQNHLVNPFSVAFPDRAWRKFLEQCPY